MNDILRKRVEKFLAETQKELRNIGMEDWEVKIFSISFIRTYEEELKLNEKFNKPEPKDIEKFMDNLLKSTIFKLETPAIKDKAKYLWSLRAEQKLKGIKQREMEPQAVAEFRKIH